MKRRYPTQATGRHHFTGMIHPRLWGLLFVMGALLMAGPVGAADRRSGEATRTTSTSSRSDASSSRSSDRKKKETSTTRSTDSKKKEVQTTRSTDKKETTTTRSTGTTTRDAAPERRPETRSTNATPTRGTETRSQRAVETPNPDRRVSPRSNQDNVGARSNDRRVQMPPRPRIESPARSDVRYYQVHAHATGLRFKHDRERCHHCHGVGIVFGPDRLHRVRCVHCYGRGFAIQFHVNLYDICPLCYGPVRGYGFPTHPHDVADVARRMTKELDYVVRLTSSQERRIYRINLDYLADSRRGDLDYWMERRDDRIYRVLNNRQRREYLDYVRSLDYRDVCDHCFNAYF